MIGSLKHRVSTVLLSLLAVAMLTGCGYFMGGSTKLISVQSTPTAATITITPMTGQFTTPITLELSRKHAYVIKAEKEGYHDANFMIRKEKRPGVFTADIFFSVMFLGIQAIVDGTTGAWNDLLPENATIVLHQVDPVRDGPDLIQVTLTEGDAPGSGAFTITSDEPVTIEVVPVVAR